VAALIRRVGLVLLVACAPGDAGRGTGAPAHDLLLRGGWIVDGTGNPRYRGDVAVDGDRIVAVGWIPEARARDTIDVTGLVVAPGFIDMLGQSETDVLIDNRLLSKVTQGITTEVTEEARWRRSPMLCGSDSAYLQRYGPT
jgi:dihydroorotase/N-acyl-D-amino-acid deacylase